MRFVFLFLLFSVVLGAGCITIVLDEQGDAAETVEEVPVEIAEKTVGFVDETTPGPVTAIDDMKVEDTDAVPEEAEQIAVAPVGLEVDPDELTPEQQAYTDERLAELRKKSQRRGDAVPLDDFDSREMLEILEFKTEKTGASKGKVSEILFVVRNYGHTTLDLNAQLLVETLITNPDFPRVERTEFDLKKIPPGMKIEKHAYLGFEIRPLDHQRKYELRLLDNSYPPKEIETTGGVFTIE